MDAVLYILLVQLLQLSVADSAHVFGTIADNVTFFYRKLQVPPSISVVIEFRVSYLQRYKVIKYSHPLMGIYTNCPKINIEKRCSFVRFGQLRNEKLHPRLGVSQLGTNRCDLSGGNTMNCRGRVTAQDYIPRNFYLTFGFHCDFEPRYSLQGLRYNISFTTQTNDIKKCTDYFITPCSRFYTETFVPNLIGDEEVNKIAKYFRQLTALEALLFIDGNCYQHVWESTCDILLPRCDPVDKKVVHLCREMCWDFVEGCWNKVRNLFSRMGLYNYHNSLYVLSPANISQLINCDYLPSRHDSKISCFYKPVTCDSQLHDVLQYACVKETFKMTGNSSTMYMSMGTGQTHHLDALGSKVSQHTLFLLCFLSL